MAESDNLVLEQLRAIDREMARLAGAMGRLSAELMAMRASCLAGSGGSETGAEER